MNKFFHFFALAATVLAAGACRLTKDDPEEDKKDDITIVKGLVIEADKYLITSDGVDGAVLTVKLDGVEVNLDEVAFYDANTNARLEIPNGYFQTTTEGSHSFWASYKTQLSPKITIVAISARIPDLPEDSGGNFDFARRVLINQFTGNGCQYCPRVISMLRSFAANPVNEDKYVLAACHTYNPDDPAFLSVGIDKAMGVTGYPSLRFDLKPKSTISQTLNGFTEDFIKEYESETAKAGVAVATVTDGDIFVVKTRIKVAEDGEYRIAVWLLEDGITAVQNNGTGISGDFNTHNNCVRMVTGKNGNTDYTGISYKLKAGDTKEHIAIFDVTELEKDKQNKPIKPVVENCHAVVLVCTDPNGSGKFSVNTAADCPANGTVAFKYNK